MTRFHPGLAAPSSSTLLVALAAVLLNACSMPQDENADRIQTARSVVAATVPTTGLIGEWKLDGNVTDTKSGFATTLVGNPPFISAKIGQGLDLTGNGNGGAGGKYVEVTQAGSNTLDDLQEGAAYSISAWFNPDSQPSGTGTATFWMVVGKTNGQAIGIVYNTAGKFAARHYLTGNILELATATSTSSLDQWHHVVMVVTKGVTGGQGSLQLYVDGALSNTHTWMANLGGGKDFSNAKWRFGKSDTEWSANGRVDQVRMYNRALSGTEVTALFTESGTVATGIPFGPGGILPTDLNNGSIFTESSLTSKNLSLVLKQLASAQGKTPVLHMWFNLVGGEQQFYTNPSNGDSSFSVTKWKSMLDAGADQLNGNGSSQYADSLRHYTDNNTLLGLILLDDINNFSPLPTFSQLEAIAAYAKLRYPGVTVAIRARPTQLKTIAGASVYSQVDVGWAQYKISLGAVSTYRDAEIAAADTAGLGIVLGINLNRGNPPPDTVTTVTQLSQWGKALLASGSSDYACDFHMFDINYGQINAPTMDTLAALAATHVASPCKVH